jgi:hypothetical protein
MKKALMFLMLPLSVQADETALQSLKTQVNLLEQKVEALADQAGPSTQNQTHIGGYGELHYNATDGKAPSFDFHRFVLLLDHSFSDTVNFYSELEVEHAIAGDGEKGAVELEQAYIDWTFKPQWHARFGMLLQPVGFINETHEPDTFYGVERPVVEKDILSTTWWSSGIGLGWRPNGWEVDLQITEGLYDATGTSIRSARQKSAKTRSSSLGYTLRADYTALAGMRLGASLYHQSDLTQRQGPSTPATLLDLHADLSRGPWRLRMLWANWTLDGANARQNGQRTQQGYYIEPSYKPTSQLGLFVRYSHWYTDANARKTRWLGGINYWIHPRVVLKADIRTEENNHGYNLGVGYSF